MPLSSHLAHAGGCSSPGHEVPPGCALGAGAARGMRNSMPAAYGQRVGDNGGKVRDVKGSAETGA